MFGWESKKQRNKRLMAELEAERDGVAERLVKPILNRTKKPRMDTWPGGCSLCLIAFYGWPPEEITTHQNNHMLELAWRVQKLENPNA